MGQHQPVPPNAITLGTFLWFIVGVFLLVTLACYICGLFMRKRKTVSRLNDRRVLQNLLKWGVLREEDIDRMLAGEGAPSEEEETEDLEALQHQARQDRVLNTPQIRQLILNRERPWAQAFLGAACGLALSSAQSAALVSVAALFTNLSGYEFTPSSIFFLGVMTQLFVVGLFGGWALGLYRGIAPAALSLVPQTLRREVSGRRVEDYRTPWIAWLPVVLLVLDLILSLILSLINPPYQPLSFIGLLGVLPALTLGVIGLCESLIHRMEQLPPVSLSDDPALAERASTAMIPRLIQVLMGIEYGVLGFLWLLHPIFLPDALTTGGKGPVVSTYAILPFCCLIVVLLLVNGAYGRLGGRLTGWPWSKRARVRDEPQEQAP